MQILLHYSDKIVFPSSPFVLLKYTKHTHTNHSLTHTHWVAHTQVTVDFARVVAGVDLQLASGLGS